MRDIALPRNHVKNKKRSTLSIGQYDVERDFSPLWLAATNTLLRLIFLRLHSESTPHAASTNAAISASATITSATQPGQPNAA